MSGKIFIKADSPSWKIAARLVLSTILDVVAATFRAIANRRAALHVASLDDRMLRDIGLTRGDVDGALAQPWHKDPTRTLVVRRLENRIRRPRPGPALLNENEVRVEAQSRSLPESTATAPRPARIA